jgi:hypothetical protein
MTKQQLQDLRMLEGRHVGVALHDGTRTDDCVLVSGGRGRLTTIWLFADGQDVFVPSSNLLDVWESRANRLRAA